MSGLPGRSSAAQARRRAAAWPAMSWSPGVVIQPSACRAIQVSVFGPPPAPMISGICAWAGFG